MCLLAGWTAYYELDEHFVLIAPAPVLVRLEKATVGWRRCRSVCASRNLLHSYCDPLVLKLIAVLRPRLAHDAGWSSVVTTQAHDPEVRYPRSTVMSSP